MTNISNVGLIPIKVAAFALRDTTLSSLPLHIATNISNVGLIPIKIAAFARRDTTLSSLPLHIATNISNVGLKFLSRSPPLHIATNISNVGLIPIKVAAFALRDTTLSSLPLHIAISETLRAQEERSGIVYDMLSTEEVRAHMHRRHPTLMKQLQSDGCLECQDGVAKNPATRWRRASPVRNPNKPKGPPTRRDYPEEFTYPAAPPLTPVPGDPDYSAEEWEDAEEGKDQDPEEGIDITEEDG